MPMSPYLVALRAKVGHDLLTLTTAAVSVFDAQERLLLAEEADTGFWTLPGGIIDPDEIPSDAAVRECWEETGLLVQPRKLIGVFGGDEFHITYRHGDVAYYTTIAFEACVIAGSHRPDGEEIKSLRYFTKNECEHLVLSPASQLIAARAFLRDAPTYFASPTWSPPRG
ncbi:NUDIX domain-containing protein [Bradyrhizobium sp.]|uniref:NUDIX domain-containing protein n=1 Tax=Bradyrhizobium sp. TaxID=376 RepID=UPI004038470D